MERPSDTFDLKGRTAIVTGGGSGIGLAMVRAFAEAGAKVAVVDIAAASAEAAAAGVTDAGGAALAIAADVGDERAVKTLVAQVRDAWGEVDILCNNAGVIDLFELVLDIDTDTWNKVMRVNLTGPFLLTREVISGMIAHKKGVIINTASQAAIRGAAGGCAYTASKHGVIGLTRSVAWAHAPDGIRCNAICPGPVDTPMRDLDPSVGYDQKGLERLMPALDLARGVGSPEQMASVAVFLASDSASFINGAILPVDLGWAAG
jgi:NAD(P)-dependent dehydrogenase (short-subunit alcohol dehydrogenase family)